MTGDNTWIAGIKGMKENGTLVDGVSGATSLGDLANAKSKYEEAAVALSKGKATEVADALKAEGQVFADKAVSLSDTFWGIEPGSVGETSAFAALLGACIFTLGWNC